MKEIQDISEMFVNRLLKKNRRRSYGKRKVWLSPGIYPDFGGMRNRTGKCVEIPLYYVKIWRGGVCAAVFVLFADFGSPYYGNGVCCRKGKPEECGVVF